MRNWRFQLHCAFRISHFALAVLNVALTGNIAAGKSTVVDLFRRWGATIIDADALVREAQAPGGAVLAAIAGRFGADVLASDGTLDRSALRGKVMGDQAALDALNQIVHPAVRRRRDELLRAATEGDRKSTRLNSSHSQISYAVFCLKKKKKNNRTNQPDNDRVIDTDRNA